APERHYVRASQVATVLLTVVSAVATFYMGSIAGAWKLLIVTGAGTGTVLLLRWYWWRINAWSEVSAMIAAFAVSVLLQTAGGFDSDRPVDFAWIMLITVGFGVFERGRETVAALVRPHRLHGDVAMDGPGPRPVHHPAHEPGPSHTRQHGDPARAAPRGRPGGGRAHTTGAVRRLTLR